MKNFTDVNQSKVLAEILPIESADMYWFVCADEDEIMEFKITNENEYHLFGGFTDWNDAPYIPCWSLAALLDVINQVREIFHQRVTFLVGRYAGGHWYIEILRVQDERSVCFEHSKELVDACYEMIIRLNKQKLL